MSIFLRTLFIFAVAAGTQVWTHEQSAQVVPGSSYEITVGWPNLKDQIHKIFSESNSRYLHCDSDLCLVELDYLPEDIVLKMKSLGNSVSVDESSLWQDDLDKRIFTSSIRDVPNKKGINMIALVRIVKTFQCTRVSITFIVNEVDKVSGYSWLDAFREVGFGGVPFEEEDRYFEKKDVYYRGNMRLVKPSLTWTVQECAHNSRLNFRRTTISFYPIL